MRLNEQRILLRNAIKKAQNLWSSEQSEEQFLSSVPEMLGCFAIYSAIRDEIGRILDFRLEYINETACINHQILQEQQIGQGLCKLMPIIYQETGLFQEYHQVVETGDPLVKEVLLYEDVNQPKKLTQAFDIRAAKLGDGFVVFWRDISKYKKSEIAQQKLLAQEQALRQQAEEENYAKDRLIGIVSHELRTLLSGIIGWASLLQEKQLNQAKMEQALKTIEQNARLQTYLIEDLLNIEHIKRGHLSLEIRPIDLAETVESAINTLQPLANDKNIRIETFVDRSIETTLADSNRLQQVVVNLLVNAIKFTPPSGLIVVRLERLGSIAQIQVSDTGQGISAEFLPYVFEEFYQEDAIDRTNYRGLGLGLAIARQLVELHNGTIEVRSEGKGKGAVFTVKLPL